MIPFSYGFTEGMAGYDEAWQGMTGHGKELHVIHIQVVTQHQASESYNIITPVQSKQY